MSYSIGFIGYGLIARPHANALARLSMFFPDAPATERAIDSGDGTVPTFEDGLAVQRVVEAIVDSDDAGRRVEV